MVDKFVNRSDVGFAKYERTLDDERRLKMKNLQGYLNDIQEGVIFFGDKRIKINYKKPKKITIILSEKKGIYINHDLKESEFFATKNSYIKFLFNIFHNKEYLKSITITESNHKIEINETITLDNDLYNIKLIYENGPIKLRRLDIRNQEEKTQMGFFNHNLKKSFGNNPKIK